MNSFKKGLSYAALLTLCVAQMSCKTDTSDYSYLENIPVQVPRNIVPIHSSTAHDLPDFVRAGNVGATDAEFIWEDSFDEEGVKVTEPVQIVESKPVMPASFDDGVGGNVLRVGVLLPLSGKMKTVGKEMQNAAIMALADTGSRNLALHFYDTKGTAADAKKAVKQALDEGAEIIVGPLLSAEVKAVAEEVQGWSVPVISFSSDNSVLGENIYSVALLVTEQIRRVVSYSCSKGYKKLAVLAQSNEMGEYAFAAAKQVMESEECGGAIVKMGFYNPNTADFSGAVKSIMPKALLMKIEKERLKKQGLEVVDGTLYDEDGNKIVDERNIPFGFDSVLLVDEGARLRSLGASLSYYDVNPEKVKILGVSMMDDAKVKKESIFNQAWYSVLPKQGFEKFAGRYEEVFKEGKAPSRIVSLTYDAVSLAAFLAGQRDYEDMHKLILAPSGFNGIDGPFRLLPDGRVERATAVMQVKKYGQDAEIAPAPKQFSKRPWERVENEKPVLTAKAQQETVEDDADSEYGYDVNYPEQEVFVDTLP